MSARIVNNMEDVKSFYDYPDFPPEPKSFPCIMVKQLVDYVFYYPSVNSFVAWLEGYRSAQEL